jgi:hypothetical protein
MSDSFQAYLFEDAEERGDFRRVPEWLISEQIVSEKLGDTALSSDGLGHFPGTRASSILIKDDAVWRMLAVNGVTFESGRQVQVSTELEFAKCPNCRHVISVDDEQFGQVFYILDSYVEGGSRGFECVNCNKISDLSDWDFDGRLAVGNYTVIFWNWPEHISQLPSKLGEIAGTRCSRVRGSL